MKTENLFFALLLSILTTFPLFAQNNTPADNIYDEGVRLLEQKQYTEAIKKFEEALTINPKHKNSLFNLAVISFDTGNREKGLEYLQASVRAGDRDAATLLKEEFQQKIALADTMHFEDVDIRPQILIKSKPEELIINGDLHPVLKKKLLYHLKNSKVLRRDAGDGKLYALSLSVNKAGIIGCELLNHPKNQTAQQELSTILQSIANIKPAVHEGKEVAVYGLAVIPIRF